MRLGSEPEGSGKEDPHCHRLSICLPPRSTTAIRRCPRKRRSEADVLLGERLYLRSPVGRRGGVAGVGRRGIMR